MGYYAHGCGDLRLGKKIPANVLESLTGFDEAEQYSSGGKDFLCLTHYDEKYFESDVYKDLDKVAPYVLDGDINFVGEDDCVWRFRFDPDCGSFVEENGKITYDFSDAPVVKKYSGGKLDFLNGIIEVFETFLDERGIVVENPEKQQSENPSNIYGTDYGDLESELEALLAKEGVL